MLPPILLPWAREAQLAPEQIGDDTLPTSHTSHTSSSADCKTLDKQVYKKVAAAEGSGARSAAIGGAVGAALGGGSATLCALLTVATLAIAGIAVTATVLLVQPAAAAVSPPPPSPPPSPPPPPPMIRVAINTNGSHPNSTIDLTTEIDLWFGVTYTLVYDAGNHKPVAGDHAWWVLNSSSNCGDGLAAAQQAQNESAGGLLDAQISNIVTMTTEEPNYVLCLRENISGTVENVLHAHVQMGVHHFPPSPPPSQPPSPPPSPPPPSPSPPPPSPSPTPPPEPAAPPNFPPLGTLTTGLCAGNTLYSSSGTGDDLNYETTNQEALQPDPLGFYQWDSTQGTLWLNRGVQACKNVNGATAVSVFADAGYRCYASCASLADTDDFKRSVTF